MNYHILQYSFIDGSCMAFLTGRFQPAKAAPDDGFAATVVPVDSAEHFTTLTANNNLSEAVVAAVTALFAIGVGLDYSSAYQFLHNLQEDEYTDGRKYRIDDSR